MVLISWILPGDPGGITCMLRKDYLYVFHKLTSFHASLHKNIYKASLVLT